MCRVISILDSREREGYSQDVGWRRRSAANKNSVLRKEYRREDQHLSSEIQPEVVAVATASAASAAAVGVAVVVVMAVVVVFVFV